MTATRLTIAAAALTLSACASTPSPEEVCSAKWIEHRTDAAMAEFRSSVRPALRTLRKVGADVQDGEPLGAVQFLRVSQAAQKTVSEFQNSRALDDLRLLGRTCDDPDLVITAFTDFLDDEGAPPQVLSILESLRSFTAMEEG